MEEGVNYKSKYLKVVEANDKMKCDNEKCEVRTRLFEVILRRYGMITILYELKSKGYVEMHTSKSFKA